MLIVPLVTVGRAADVYTTVVRVVAVAIIKRVKAVAGTASGANIIVTLAIVEKVVMARENAYDAAETRTSTAVMARVVIGTIVNIAITKANAYHIATLQNVKNVTATETAKSAAAIRLSVVMVAPV